MRWKRARPGGRSFLSPHRPAHLAGRSAAMSLADDLGDLVVAAAATASVAFSLYVTRDVTPRPYRRLPALSPSARPPPNTKSRMSARSGPCRSLRRNCKMKANRIYARRSRHAHRVLARARCRCTPSPSILRGAFDSLYAQTADMLEGLQAQLCHAYRTITGVRYEPLNEMADGIGTSTDAAIQALIELGLATGTPARHTTTLLGSRFSTPDGLWDTRLHDVIDAQLGLWHARHEAAQSACSRLNQIADAESRNGGAK